MTQILLLRHGATDLMRSHLAGRLGGVSLNALGRAQASALAARIAMPDVLLTSPVQRAQETAEIIGKRHGIGVAVEEEITEFDFGSWTGRTFEDLSDDGTWRAFNHSRETARAPGGESMADVQKRAVRALARIAGALDKHPAGKTAAIVSHGDVIRAILLHVAAAPLQNYWRFTVDAASISELSWEGAGSERIIRVNDCAHLEHFAEEKLGYG